MSTWIDCEAVHLARGGRPVLQGLEAHLSGRATGLVGANGAGKSTLIGALLGILRPDRGSIRVLELDVRQHALDVRARAGVMAEQAGLFPGGSGVDAVTFAGMLSGLSRREALRRAHRALDALDVAEERYRPTAGYSTGMRQRCKLAMALVHDPEVLILDEPTLGLDPPGRHQLLTLIRELRDEGRRILLSTHLLSDAEFLCDELLLVEAGTVAYCGPLGGLVSRNSTLMVAESPSLDERWVTLLRAEGFADARLASGQLLFTVRGDDDLRRFWQAIVREGLEVRRLVSGGPSLEDAVLDRLSGEVPAEGSHVR